MERRWPQHRGRARPRPPAAMRRPSRSLRRPLREEPRLRLPHVLWHGASRVKPVRVALLPRLRRPSEPRLAIRPRQGLLPPLQRRLWPGRYKDAGPLLRVRGRVPPRASRPEPEATVEEEPLRGGGMRGPVAVAEGRSSGWKLHLEDPLRRSFVSFRESAFPRSKLREWFQKLHDSIEWNRPKVGLRRLPRSAAWLVGKGCRCTYRYSGTAWPALTMESWFQEITEQVCKVCGIREPPNSCNANLYEDGSQAVGWHADDEPLFDATSRDALIVSLSLGATRHFELRPNDEPEEITRMTLADGDLCTMEGLVQKHYQHRVPTQRNISEPRINLTWRWIVAHDPNCPLYDSTIRRPPAKRSYHEASTAWRKPAASAEAEDPEERERRRRRLARFSGKADVVAQPPRRSPLRVSLKDTCINLDETEDEADKRRKRAARFKSMQEKTVDLTVEKECSPRPPSPRAALVGGEDGATEAERRRKRQQRFGESQPAASKAEEAPAAKRGPAGLDRSLDALVPPRAPLASKCLLQGTPAGVTSSRLMVGPQFVASRTLVSTALVAGMGGVRLRSGGAILLGGTVVLPHVLPEPRLSGRGPLAAPIVSSRTAPELDLSELEKRKRRAARFNS